MEKRYQFNTKEREEKTKQKETPTMNTVRRQKLFLLPSRLRCFSGLYLRLECLAGKEANRLYSLPSAQHQTLYRHQTLTKHKEERQQNRAADQHLKGLDNFNTSLPKIPFLILLRKISSKRDGQPSQLMPKPCASSQVAVPASPTTAAGQMHWFSWVKGCG